MGIEDTLKLAKRPLEYKLFKQSTLEKILKRPINEIFVDWSLKADKGYAVLTLQKSKHENSFSSEMLFFMCWQRKIPEASGYLLVLLLLENILILTKQAL